MSLNGLDDDAVIQAYQAALVEAGGWFLLKYTNRDTVCVLDKGNGGVSEVRGAVGDYEEKSPLYGLVQYRRKKIILKYVPEGTSRLLQVRLAVQFQSILDTFTSHDTVFSFTTAEELSDSALGLCTINLQHTGSKTSSSSSLRQRRLNEITETVEENTSATPMAVPSKRVATNSAEKQSSDYMASSPASVTRAKELLKRRNEDLNAKVDAETNAEPTERFIETTHTTQTQDTFPSPVSPLTDNGGSSSHGVPSKISGTFQSMAGDSITRPSFDFSVPGTSMDSDDDVHPPVPKELPLRPYSAHLTAAESNDISRWTDDVVASTKQKRAPRPHVEAHSRPKTAGTNESPNLSRPVANLPTSIRVSNRISSQSSRPESRQSTRSVPPKFMSSANSSPPLPIPMPVFPQVPSYRPTGQSPASQAPSDTDDGSAVTPEKLRLMKALQMRKRNQFLAQRSTSTVPSDPDQSTGIENLDSHASESNTAKSLSTSSISTNADILHHGQDLASINESETTSPTSVVTTSDHQSTKPSSFSTSSMWKRSQTSLSSGTDSSSTPKADSDNKQPTDAPVEDSFKPGSEQILVSVASISETVQSPVGMLQDHTRDISLLRESANVDRLHQDQSLKDSKTQEDSRSLQLKTKNRHVFGGSIQIPASADASDTSDDESFLEEMQNATVHEAKPVSVNRTPVTPVVAKTPTKEFLNSSTKMTTPNSISNDSQVSTPNRRRTTSRAGSTRSISTALPQWPPPQVEPVPALQKQKPTLGSNISKRIKALEGLSHRDNASSAGTAKDSTIRPGLTTLLKRSSFLTQLSSTIMTPEKPNLVRAVSSPLFAEPEVEEPKPTLRPLVQRPGTSTEVYTPVQKGETVSVTARIIRDPVKPKSAHGTSDTMKSLHRSPLIVEHETFGISNTRPSFPRAQTTVPSDSVQSNDNRRFSFSSHRSTVRRLSSAESKTQSLSVSSPRKRSSKSASETSSVVEDKRSSRTNRMLKRLSGFGRSRGSKERQSSPARDVSTPQPNTIQEQTEMDSDSMRHVVDIGEVNVQFPEILLWKRRFLRVDDQGYLIFATPSNDHSTRGRSRKIHLDEFTRPYLPDIEHEEMAWSIILGLKDGRSVQCACESREAQKATLKLLTDAHRAYHQLYRPDQI